MLHEPRPGRHPGGNEHFQDTHQASTAGAGPMDAACSTGPKITFRAPMPRSNAPRGPVLPFRGCGPRTPSHALPRSADLGNIRLCPSPESGKEPTPRGFEPLRAEPNGFLVHHRSHSVTVSLVPTTMDRGACHTWPAARAGLQG